MTCAPMNRGFRISECGLKKDGNHAPSNHPSTRNPKSAIELLVAAAHRGDFAGEVVFALGDALAHLVAREASDGDALARLGYLLGQQLVDGLRWVFDERLV